MQPLFHYIVLGWWTWTLVFFHNYHTVMQQVLDQYLFHIVRKTVSIIFVTVIGNWRVGFVHSSPKPLCHSLHELQQLRTSRIRQTNSFCRFIMYSDLGQVLVEWTQISSKTLQIVLHKIWQPSKITGPEFLNFQLLHHSFQSALSPSEPSFVNDSFQCRYPLFF